MELHQCPYKAALFIQRAPPCAVLLAVPAHLSQRRPPCFATRASAPLWTRTATLHVRPPSQPDASAFMLVRGLTRIPSAFRPLDNLCDTERNALNYFLLPHTPEGKQQLSAIKEAIDRRGMRAPLVRGERPVLRRDLGLRAVAEDAHRLHRVEAGDARASDVRPAWPRHGMEPNQARRLSCLVSSKNGGRHGGPMAPPELT